MRSKLNLAEDPLPNPFAEGDAARDELEQCKLRLDDLERINRMLMDSVGLLMRIQNIKDDRARGRFKENEAPNSQPNTA